MSEVIISVENLGKSYRIRPQAERQRYVALRDVIAHRVKELFRNRKSGNRKSEVRSPFANDPQKCSLVRPGTEIIL